MDTPGIDLSPLRKALGVLAEALQLWHSQDAGSVLKPHLRSADRVTDLSFNELLRHAADAGLVQDPNAWRTWRELRNATSHAYDEVKAEQVAHDAERFCVDARSLLAALEAAL